MKYKKQFENLAKYFHEDGMSKDEIEYFNKHLLEHIGEENFDSMVQYGVDEGVDADKQVEWLKEIIKKNESED